jgi:hypothetical protein
MSVKGQRKVPSPADRPTRRPIRLVTPDDPRLDPKLQAHIGEQLRAYYAGLMSEPVPERLVELLKRLDRKH